MPYTYEMSPRFAVPIALAACLAASSSAAVSSAAGTPQFSCPRASIASPRAIELRGTYTEGDVPGTFVKIVDLRTGFSRIQKHSAATASSEGFDGTQWSAQNGIVERTDLPGLVRVAHAHAFADRLGWRTGANRDVHVHRMPNGLADRAIIDADIGPETVVLSDWRCVSGIAYPFRQSLTDSTGERTAFHALHARLVHPTSSAFAPPPRVDHALLHGTQPVEVPFEFISARDSHMIVPASVNGHTTPVIFDTGGANYFGLQFAQQSGLTVGGGMNIMGPGTGSITAGVAQVKSISIGPAELRDVTGIVAPLPWPNSPGAPQGAAGFEFFAELRTTIDYERKVLQFETYDRPLSAAGAKLPVYSDGHTLYLTATVNGKSGLFMVDTGAGSAITIFKPFADAIALETADSKVDASGSGVGGKIPVIRTALNAFSIAGKTIPNAKASISLNRAGAFASRSVAGNLGGPLLRCFRMTIDDRARMIVLGDEPGTAECLQRLRAQ